MMIEYVRAALILRLKARHRSLAYCQKFEEIYRKREERRTIERLLRSPRKAA